jgi:hypothetical protein
MSVSCPTLRLWPAVFAMTPDGAMALSIELQKAAIDARQCERRQPSGQGLTGRNGETDAATEAL